MAWLLTEILETRYLVSYEMGFLGWCLEGLWWGMDGMAAD